MLAERWRLAGWLEGMSFLVLLGIAMPLKHLAGWPHAVQVVGMAHGVLFLIYVALILYAGWAQKWRKVKVVAGLLASVVPFGPFLFHGWVRREEEKASAAASN